MADYIPLHSDVRSYLCLPLRYDKPFTQQHITSFFYWELLRLLESQNSAAPYTFFTIIGCGAEQEVIKASLAGNIGAVYPPVLLQLQFARAIGTRHYDWRRGAPIKSCVSQSMVDIIVGNQAPKPSPVISAPTIQESIQDDNS